ncbi:hypothetical protein [Billgrantia ethanolica]|uniref:Uncharacterized protein n=1 Tax=Billgrantia ethanolica TaxID=2733486 RepID=A0ABS9A2A6_9GAMM|nr:hypothetical protein [Halomonas ethanolica]MCE8002886.1 hypothetical protein [Halomonas ethanolica]
MTRRLSSNGSAGPRRRVIAFLKRHLRSWYVGLVLLLGLVLVVTHLGELESFARLARNAEPGWLFVALGFQLLTYVSAAAVWHQILRHAQVGLSLRALVLTLLGVPLEAALTATLLLRGMTLWLPMLPGLWFARRALR